MRVSIACATAAVLCISSGAAAQPPNSDAPLEIRTTEWMVTAGPAFGVSLFKSAERHRYFMQQISWGRVLSRPVGDGLLRGTFEWSVEVVPLFGQYAPEDTYGFGITPLQWRWNFEPRGALAPFAELGGGALWTRAPVPALTSSANFTAHLAYGVRYFLRSDLAFVGSYRFHHISNGNRLNRNPGVNAHVAQFGVSIVRRSRAVPDSRGSTN
jgi:hypothetical protein